MKLDRDLQHTILNSLADRYPESLGWTAMSTKYVQHNLPEGEGKLWANLMYLSQHGLIAIHKPADEDDEHSFSATHHGLDFLADDGGLSAILGVVTIRLHDDTLKSLIEAKILQSDLPQPDKKRWLDQLRSLPAETTKHLALKLVDLGLANAPAALVAIGSALGLGAAG